MIKDCGGHGVESEREDTGGTKMFPKNPSSILKKPIKSSPGDFGETSTTLDNIEVSYIDFLLSNTSIFILGTFLIN